MNVLLTLVFGLALSFSSHAQELAPAEEPAVVIQNLGEGANQAEVVTVSAASPRALRRAVDWIKSHLRRESADERFVLLGLNDEAPKGAAVKARADARLAAAELAQAAKTEPKTESFAGKTLQKLWGGTNYLVTITVIRTLYTYGVNWTGVAVSPDFSAFDGAILGVVAAAPVVFFTMKGFEFRQWVTAQRISKLFGLQGREDLSRVQKTLRTAFNRFEEYGKMYLTAFTAIGLFKVVAALVQDTAPMSFAESLSVVHKTALYETLAFAPLDAFFGNHERRRIREAVSLPPKLREAAGRLAVRNMDISNFFAGMYTSTIVLASVMNVEHASLGFAALAATGYGLGVFESTRGGESKAVTLNLSGSFEYVRELQLGAAFACGRAVIL